MHEDTIATIKNLQFDEKCILKSRVINKNKKGKNNLSPDRRSFSESNLMAVTMRDYYIIKFRLKINVYILQLVVHMNLCEVKLPKGAIVVH